MLVPPTRTSLVDSVVIQLQDVILESMSPGDRLPSERALSESLGVSRIVTREALKQLSERGLIDVQPGVGMFVRKVEPGMALKPLQLYIDQQNIPTHQLFEIRFLLETAVAARAAHTRGGDLSGELKANLEEMHALVTHYEQSEAVDERITERLAWLDVEFHMLLARSTGNHLFEALLTPLLGALIRIRRQGLSLQGTARKALEEHISVHAAVVAGDAERAESMMQHHLEHVRTWVQEAERETNPSDSKGA
jgi:GntR family transcriptional repressor for pyruvate dehydrogenase complex